MKFAMLQDLTPDQTYQYHEFVFGEVKYLNERFKDNNYTFTTNNSNFYVILENGEPYKILKPRVKNNHLSFVHSVMSRVKDKKCHVNGCNNDSFGTTSEPESLPICHKHYDLWLKKIKGLKPLNNTNDKSNFETFKDIDGSFAKLYVRNKMKGYRKNARNKFVDSDFTLIDTEDLDFFITQRVSKHERYFYCRRRSGDKIKSIRINRLIMAHKMYGVYDETLLPPRLVVHHLDDNSGNNRRHNLGLTTQLQNATYNEINHCKKFNKEFYGLGVHKTNHNTFTVPVYKIIPRLGYIPVDTKEFSDLREGLEWKFQEERKLMIAFLEKEYNHLIESYISLNYKFCKFTKKENLLNY